MEFYHCVMDLIKEQVINSFPATVDPRIQCGLMSQSLFDVNIKEDDYLAKLCPDPHLFISSMPSDDQLKKQYSKLLEGVILLKQRISRGETLSAVSAVSPLINLEMQHDGRSARVG